MVEPPKAEAAATDCKVELVKQTEDKPGETPEKTDDPASKIVKLDSFRKK